MPISQQSDQQNLEFVTYLTLIILSIISKSKMHVQKILWSKVTLQRLEPFFLFGQFMSLYICIYWVYNSIRAIGQYMA